jgi:hypothetical protein
MRQVGRQSANVFHAIHVPILLPLMLVSASDCGF